MSKLWEKNETQHSLAEAYCFGDNVVLDNKLVKADVLGSTAHARMLSTIGILTDKDFNKLKKCLLEILKLAQENKFTVSQGDEDVHTKVENYLVEKLGDLGKKIHTGRSRNDQVLLDLRLYTKEKLFEVADESMKLTKAFTSFAKKYEWIPMPGYTHMQKAMPSSVGLWSGSFAESLIDDLALLKAAHDLNNQSPLGSGAAYGVSLPLDRELVAQLLGFAKVQNNSLYCQASRGKFQLTILHALSQLMLSLSRFASDLLLFTTSEFNFFTVAPALCTGSSIMPQKKNLDVMEVVRARTHLVQANYQAVASIISGLGSGYHADFGETKEPLMKSLDIAINSFKIVNLTLQSIKPNENVLKTACSQEIFATHYAYQLVKEGMPFRDAYKKVGLALKNLPSFQTEEVLKQSSHLGGTGNLGLDCIQTELTKEAKWWEKQKDYFTNTIEELIGGEINEK